MTARGEVTTRVTDLLAALDRGERDAFDRLLPLLYEQLRAIAHREARRAGAGDTLRTTAVVNEAYLKLVARSEQGWRSRSHFLGVAATAMRHILVDAARRRSATKHGGELRRTPLEHTNVAVDATKIEVLALNEALGQLSAVDERLGRLVELRAFGGLSIEETAQVLGVASRTVNREWRIAKAFLYRSLGGRLGEEEGSR